MPTKNEIIVVIGDLLSALTENADKEKKEAATGAAIRMLNILAESENNCEP